MPKVIPGRVTWLSPLPRGRRTTPNYSRRARMLLIKQINDLDFFTVRPTLPLPPLPGCQFFMSFRGPKAHHNRSHTSDTGCSDRVDCALQPCYPLTTGSAWYDLVVKGVE
jgi:hypothetical protein